MQMRDTRHFVHLELVVIGGWWIKVSMHDITSMFCLVMFNPVTGHCLVSYIEDEQDVILAIFKQVESNGSN